MDITLFLLANGFFLALILTFLLVLFAINQRKTPSPQRKRVKSDLKKIKSQVQDEEF